MTLQDLGNIGELTAAIATVATLAYLAVQIRQNSKSIRGSAAQALLNLELDTFALIARHPGIYRRGCANLTDLDADERVVFEQLVLAEISRMYAGFAQFQNGLISEAELAGMLSDWRRDHLKQPGFQSIWAAVRHGYSDDFCQRLEEVGSVADACD